MLKLLALVCIYPAGADIKAAPGKAYGPISKEGQQWGLCVAFIRGMGRKRVPWGDKSGHSRFRQACYPAASRVKPGGAAAGQEKEVASRGQYKHFVRARDAPLAAAAADHQ
ncbi:hypothetical protein [Candidatus Desulfovibrio trichonymphae]|uniref:hypothetical protein n=1 Tax=Candidatus Desulfovibrio trichonymphae TaxID=1725232 RepID=UPI001E519F87|nr:hypothetical protein [Candidatus Desulfovibrio trichonymphae]GHU99009.1 hypothetical protein AGMMS50248_06460 [Deltaproteobacteria bacterium]